METSDELTIGQVAKLARVNIETLRYYERRRIIRPKARRVSGYRIYDADAVRQVRFVKRCQKLGFSLRAIQGLLSLCADKKSKCGEVKRRAVQTLDQVEKKISELESMKRALSNLIQSCDARKTGEDCPILVEFDTEAESETGNHPE